MDYNILKKSKYIAYAALGGLLAIIPALLAFLWIAAPAAASEQAVTLSEPTYILEMTTGVTSGTEDQIDFFIVNYIAEGSSEVNSAFVFKSDAVINNGEIDPDESVYSRNYQKFNEPFRSYATDQYIFTTPKKINKVDSIQIFCEAQPTKNREVNGAEVHDSGNGSWACQGIRLFRVDKAPKLGNSYMLSWYNTFSKDLFLNFDGELIAEGEKNKNINWATDKLITIAGKNSKLENANFVLTTEFDSQYAAHPSQDRNQKKLAVRFDFADMYQSGLESLTSTSGTFSTSAIVESIAVTVQYTDRYGGARETMAPLAGNSVVYCKSLGLDLSGRSVAGLAEQGESLVGALFLPDFASFRTDGPFTVTIGGTTIENMLGISSGTGTGMRGVSYTIERPALSVSETDNDVFAGGKQSAFRKRKMQIYGCRGSRQRCDYSR